MRLRYHVEHHPDGGEATTIARFGHKGDAIAFAQGRVLGSRNDIREMTVWDGQPRRARSVLLARGGWALYEAPEAMFVVLR